MAATASFSTDGLAGLEHNFLTGPWERHLLGLGDLLAIESAARDNERREPSEVDAAAARAVLDRVIDQVEDLRHPSADGVRFLAECMQEKVAIGLRAGHPYYEEGTEHYLAYLWEARGGQAAFHGELLWAGLAASAVLQGWPERRRAVYRVLARTLAGVFRTPAQLAGTAAAPDLAFADAASYCRRNGYTNTVLLDDPSADVLQRAARAWTAATF